MVAQNFQRELGIHQTEYDHCMKSGKIVKDHAPMSEQASIQQVLDDLRNRWNAICNTSIDRQRSLEEGLLLTGQFNEAVAALLDWLKSVQSQLEPTQKVRGDLDTVTALVDAHGKFASELKARETNVDTVKKAGDELRQTSDSEGRAEIDAHLNELENFWRTINDASAVHSRRLDDALEEAQKFHKQSNGLLEWLEQIEKKLRAIGLVAREHDEIEKQIEKMTDLQDALHTKESEFDELIELGQSIKEECHANAEQPLKHWIAVLQSRWKEVSDWASEKQQTIKDEQFALKQHDALLDELIGWVNTKDDELQLAEEIPLPDDLDQLNGLIAEHEQFEKELRERQQEVDEATKTRRPNDNDALGKKNKKQDPTKVATKVQLLQQKWRQLWLAAMERKRKLNDQLEYLKEVKRLENFSWDAWRRGYMTWINNKKSRALDYFRRQDKNGDGKLPREQFIDTILGSKFPTTRLEMHKVADLFDSGDGMIDYREFVNALRPDRNIDTKPRTDQEQIDDEIQRQKEVCTCKNKFPINHVSEGKYRFGENQKLRLVRILRSTVMVRVGGGWEALDEFLLKHDPCRAKGRTNLELREKFILAEGVTQSMRAFTEKRGSVGSPSSSTGVSPAASTSSTPIKGPITKIREKTERSVPMSPAARSSTQQRKQQRHNGSQNAVDVEVASITSTGTDSRLPVRASGGLSSRSSSRPGSRAGSDAGSDVAYSTPTRIPSMRKKPKS